MKKFVLALATAAAFAVPSFASAAPGADPQATAAVKAMFDAIDMHETLSASFAEMQKTMPAMMRQQIAAMIQADPQLNEAQKKEAMARMERLLPGMIGAMAKTFSDPTLIDAMIVEMTPLYTNNYTVDEIRQLTAFYQTPLGRKMMTLTPRLSSESMAVGQRIMMPRIGKMMQDLMQELQKQ